MLRLFGVLLVIASFIVSWAWRDYQLFVNQSLVVKHPIVIEIQAGSSFNHIVQVLQESQLPVNKYWLKLLAYKNKLTHQLKAGEYELPVGITATQLLDLLSKGTTRQHQITFPEGWAFKELRHTLAKNSYLQHTIAQLTDAQIMQQLGSQYEHPEGLFFPDTYHFEKHDVDSAILQRAYKKMQQVLAIEWEKRRDGLPLKSSYEALILASIVEKETGDASERALIAGVFIRRLNKKMRLQTDPTVIYGMGEHYQGNIRKKDLRTLTPYNTYKINGLPPTPIAMPGKGAIHAVLHPSTDGSLYFVAKGDGTHVFSTSLTEHNKAVNAYQRKRR